MSKHPQQQASLVIQSELQAIAAILLYVIPHRQGQDWAVKNASETTTTLHLVSHIASVGLAAPSRNPTLAHVGLRRDKPRLTRPTKRTRPASSTSRSCDIHRVSSSGILNTDGILTDPTSKFSYTIRMHREVDPERRELSLHIAPSGLAGIGTAIATACPETRPRSA